MTRSVEAITGQPALMATFAVLGIALAVRLVRIGSRSLWLDEAYTARLIESAYASLLSNPDPFHPPLYPVLLKAWSESAPVLASDTGLRLFSALASAASVAAGFWVMVRRRLAGAWLGAFLSAFSATSVWYGQEARSSATAGLLLTLAGASLVLVAFEGEAAPRRRASWHSAGLWTLYVAAATCACYVHYDALPVLGLLNLAFVGAALRRRRGASRWLAWLVANGGVCLFFWPQARFLANSLSGIATHPYVLRLAPYAALAGVAGLVVAVGLVAAGHRWARLRTRGIAAIAAALVLLLAAFGAIEQGASVKRHIAILIPLVLPAAAMAVASAGVSLRWKTALVIATLPALVAVLFVHQKEDWRGVAAFLEDASRPDDAIVLYRGYISLPLTRYYRGERTLTEVATLDEFNTLRPQLARAPRVWLVESHTDVPSSLVPYVAGTWRVGCAMTFHRVSLYRLDLASGNAGSQPAKPAACSG